MILKNKIHYLGILSLILGICAISVAVFQEDIRAWASPKEKLSIKELAIEKGKELLRTNVLGEEVEEPKNEKSDWVQFLFMGLGLVSIVLGVISWINKGNARLSAGAIALAFVALAWHYVYMAIGIAIFIIILGSLGS